MSKRSVKDLDEKDWEFVRKQYMEYTSIRAIADELNVDNSSLWLRIKNNGWKAERDMMKAELFKTFSESKRKNFVKMSEASIKIISKSLEHLANRGEPPTTREAKDATVILEALDKITRLDDGKPTEITEEKVVDFQELEEVLALSPFRKPKLIEEVEYEEIVNDDEESGKTQ